MNLPLKIPVNGRWTVRHKDADGIEVDDTFEHEDSARHLVAALRNSDALRAQQARALGHKTPARCRWALYDPSGHRDECYLDGAR